MILILKGFIIGIGKIIPGVSGSLIAINLGIYEKAIECITNFFKDIKNNIKYLGLLGVGILLSISLFSKVIVYLLNSYYVVTMLIFIGLILGSTEFKRIKKYHYISWISFSIMILFSLLKVNSMEINFEKLSWFYMLIIGIIDSATMIIPGISGTGILMLLGVYNLIINTYSNILNISLLINNIVVLGPFFIGIVLGFFIIARIINWCFKKYYFQTYKAIEGFMYGTIVFMFISIVNNYHNINEIIIGFIFGLIGFRVIKKINHLL